MKKMVKVTQTGSSIGKNYKQGLTLRGLGLRYVNHSVVVEDTPSVRGMIAKVRHLIRVDVVHCSDVSCA